MDFLFRVSTDLRYGKGHLARMLALRSNLIGSARWFVDPGNISAVRALIPSQDEIKKESSIHSVENLIKFAKYLHPKAVLCDSYNIDYKNLLPTENKTYFFCDVALDINAENFFIVNCQPGSKNNNHCYGGPAYLPIEIKKAPASKLDFDNIERPVDCLISFGATDTRNQTSKVLSEILSDNDLRNSIKPICLIGPHFNHLESVKSLLTMFPSSRVILDGRSILELSDLCPLAIGAPGHSHAERLFLGMATVLVAQNELHHPLCKNWVATGCALYAGASMESLTESLVALMSKNFWLARKVSLQGQKTVDGKGGMRIAQIINAS